VRQASALLGDDVADVRRAAAWAMGCLGSPSSKEVKQIASRLKDKNEDVRRAAAWAILQFGVVGTYDEQAVLLESLKEGLSDRCTDVRLHLVAALCQVCDCHPVVLEWLKAISEGDSDVWVRGAAAKAVGGPKKATDANGRCPRARL